MLPTSNQIRITTSSRALKRGAKKCIYTLMHKYQELYWTKVPASVTMGMILKSRTVLLAPCKHEAWSVNIGAVTVEGQQHEAVAEARLQSDPNRTTHLLLTKLVK